MSSANFYKLGTGDRTGLTTYTNQNNIIYSVYRTNYKTHAGKHCMKQKSQSDNLIH